LEELVFSRALKSIQEVLILPTLRMPKETSLPPEPLTSSLLVKARSKSLPFSQEKESKDLLKKKETLNKSITIEVVMVPYEAAESPS